MRERVALPERPREPGKVGTGASMAECEDHSGAAWLRGRTKGNAGGSLRRFPHV
ncbi:MAG TPA: hypothetical protein H9716_08885 [Candidatus Enterocloster faecavium]|uniref:Uncharacterized protein n=1 Tax=Candidatus Enterocloster faecavium TaxID=2838560 RepID=A0A9D2L8G2_9FIRM|nr:hypothetical protein [Candidatus Enterocloster faecavium]